MRVRNKNADAQNNKTTVENTPSTTTTKLKHNFDLGCKNLNLFAMGSGFIFRILIAQKRVVTRAKRSNDLFKIRTGNIVEWTVVLTKIRVRNFLLKLIVNIFHILEILMVYRF